jgi:hypothetical protein
MSDSTCVRPRSLRNLDGIWLRRSLGICDYLEKVRSLTNRDRAVVSFAIMWAPYGGSERDELFVTFGLHPAEYAALLTSVLTPTESDREEARELKSLLREDLELAWSSGGDAQVS